MRVAQISPTYFDSASIVGGAERYVWELSRALSVHVHTSFFTFSKAQSQLSVHMEGRLEIRRYPATRFIRSNLANPLTIGFLKDLRSYDCLHCHGYPNAVTDFSILLARVLGKAVFATDHHSGGVCASTYLSKIGIDTRRFLDGFLVLSKHNAEKYSSYQGRVHLIGPGVDAEHFHPVETTHARRVLFVGRLLSIKGVDYLIEALGPGMKLRVIGPVYDEDYFAHLQQLAQGKAVEFRTNIAEGDLVREYASALVTVVPSVYTDRYGRVSAGELLGLVALESMACGTPVIVTRCGGLPEVVEDGVTGFIVSPNNPAALKEKIAFLMSHPEMAAGMGAAGRKRVARDFTWQAVAERCLAAYREALGSAERSTDIVRSSAAAEPRQ